MGLNRSQFFHPETGIVEGDVSTFDKSWRDLPDVCVLMNGQADRCEVGRGWSSMCNDPRGVEAIFLVPVGGWFVFMPRWGVGGLYLVIRDGDDRWLV